MTLKVKATGNYTPSLPGKTAYVGAHKAITLIDASNYNGNPGTIGRSGGWRADRQRPMANHINLQVQKDNVSAPSSIAIVLVPKALAGAIGSVHSNDSTVKATATARFGELTRAIHKGLNESLKSRRLKAGTTNKWEMKVFEVYGNFSS